MTQSIDGLSFALSPLVTGYDMSPPDPPAIPDLDSGPQAFDRLLDSMLKEQVASPGVAWANARPATATSGQNWEVLYNRLLEQSLLTPVIRPGHVEQVAAHVPVHSRRDMQAAAGDSRTAISDAEYFNADALRPEEIDQILADKGSPYAHRVLDGGKSAGQLVWEKAHQAGTVESGPHTLNPALILAIMGAETSFGGTGWGATNPFNVKLNGSFDTVRTFEESLSVAANTMYNWAMERPAGAATSYFDFAGNYYCENYTQTWKPNVESFYGEFVGQIDDIPQELAENG